MPKENIAICDCGKPLEVPKSRNGLTSISNLTIDMRKPSKNSKDLRTKKHDKNDVTKLSKIRTSDDGSTSSVTEQLRPNKNSTKQEKRLNSSRRTRSAERNESHYTYIDSGSSIVGSGIRDDRITEALYATIPELPNTSSNLNTSELSDTSLNRSQPVYSIPSMTSPPPTYDVAIAKTLQNGLPPSYEDYLCTKFSVVSRSHTPPPPWSDTTNQSVNIQNTRRDLLVNQPELREYLARIALANNIQQNSNHQYNNYDENDSISSSQQALRKHVKQQRVRAMSRRSLSESRAHQQRLATMCEDGAFCMETTVIQSAFENGVAFCSLM